MRLPLTLLIVFQICFLCGACAQSSTGKTKVNIDLLSRLKPGLTQGEVETFFGGKGCYQFTALIGTNKVCCISFLFGRSYVSYYFVFENGLLTKVVPSPPIDEEIVARGNKQVSVQKHVDSEARLTLVLNLSDLSGQQLVNSIKAKLPKENESVSVVPAFILTAPLWILASTDIKKDYSRNNELAERFNPYKIDVGMPLDIVESRLGAPARTVQRQGETILVFGSDEPLRVNPIYRFSWIAVVVQNSKTVRVFGSDFFDKRWRLSEDKRGQVSTSDSAEKPLGN